MRRPFSRLTPLFALACSISYAFGQTTLGTVLGRITDPSGAVVPKVHVTLRNENTNVSTSKDSGGDGEYLFPNVHPGSYQIEASAGGFAQYNLEHLDVAVSQTVRADIKLAVGTTSSSVQVSAEHPLVQTDTASIGSVIESKQVNQMPLDGRTSIFGLLALAPGVQTGASGGASARISGNTWIGTNETMDGVSNMEGENSRLSSADPSLESIQEFRVIDSTGSAEYGGGTAQIILSSKSGTNQHHGSLFFYNRNRALAARNFFLPTTSRKPPYDRSEFGTSLGGPIKRNKLFFFGSYEGLLFHSSVTSLSAQPTTQLLNGDFSGLAPVIDPATGQPFPGNQIPTSRMSSVSKSLFQYFSVPNLQTGRPGNLGSNYVTPASSHQHNYRYEGRVDYTITPRDSLFVRYYYTDQFSKNPGITELMGGYTLPLSQQSVAANYTRTINTHLVNLATFGWTNEVDHFYSQHTSFDPSTIIPGLTEQYPGLGGLPSVTITGFTGISDSINAGDVIPTDHFSDTLTWDHNHHTIAAGFSYLRYQFYDYGNGSPSHGSFNFNGQYSGNAFADFLLGYLAGSSESLAPVAIETRNHRYGIFVQDNWRATPKLTLNYGIRYDLPTIYQNDKGGMANWYPSLNAIVVLKGGFNPNGYPGLPIVPGSVAGYSPDSYVRNGHKKVAPRFGIIYRPLSTPVLIVRAGYGIYFESMPWKFGSFNLGANPPFSGSESFEPAAGTTPSLFFDAPFPVGQASVPSAVGLVAQDYNMHYPYTHQWNFTLESQISPNTSLRASYLGSTRIHSGAIALPNTPPQAAGPVQPRRPYQPFGTITSYSNYQTSETEQLQLAALRTYSSGLSYGIEYAWTKTLNASKYDASAPTDPQNPNYDRGNDPLIRQQYLVANYVFDLPFGRNRRYLGRMPGFANAVFGNWETSGVMTLASGLPFSVTFDSNKEGWISSRADKVDSSSISNRSIHQWFNPSAYAVPAPFTFGNSGANSLFGPGYVDWDFGVYKNFPVREAWRVQFRTEFFNALNHPNFGNPHSDITVPSQVGTITSAGSPRDIQFALRLDF
jgi:Carboxypeptidase regulatory-like domain/TonB dependent receptor